MQASGRGHSPIQGAATGSVVSDASGAPGEEEEPVVTLGPLVEVGTLLKWACTGLGRERGEGTGSTRGMGRVFVTTSVPRMHTCSCHPGQVVVVIDKRV